MGEEGVGSMTPDMYLQKIESATKRGDLEWIGKLFGQQIANGDLTEAEQLRIDEALTRRWGDIAPRTPCIARRADEIADCIAAPEVRSEIHASKSSIFPKRKHIASPDREKSRLRRRELGLSRSMPEWMAKQCVESFRAVGAKIAELHLMFGQCTWPIDRIAAESGTSPTTVRNFRRWAVKAGYIESIVRERPGRTHDTNIVRILSRLWLKWLEKRKKLQRGIGCNGFNPLRSTKERELNTAGFPDVDNTGDKAVSGASPPLCREALSGAPS
jgi:hypothetical protein